MEDNMALSDRPFGRRVDPDVSGPLDRKPGMPALLPVLLAAAAAVLLIALFFPMSGRVGDAASAGSSVQTVTPQLTPSTSPPVPTPRPTTDPRPTQAPIQ
jgi:hypothetical protein